MRVFTNFASSQLASGIIAADGQCTIGALEAALFPSPTGGDYAVCVLEDVDGNVEVVHLTARSGTLCTITRAREGTSAQDFAAGSRLELRPTAAVMTSFLQKDGDEITGTIAMTGAGKIEGGGYHDGEVVNTPIRGDTGVTTNQFLVPPGGGAPTIGGQNVYHVGNLTRTVVAGILYPTGVIVMWFGALISVPAGWVVCDGTNGTPDLRDRFIVGAGTTYALGATGGAATATTDDGDLALTIGGTALTVNQLPAHSHLLAANVSASDAPSASNFLARETAAGGDTEYNLRGTSSSPTVLKSGDAGAGATHDHTAGDMDHTHEVATLPPYFGLYFIMKT